MKYKQFLFLLLPLIWFSQPLHSQIEKTGTASKVGREDIKKELQSDYYERLYSKTYYSLIGRMRGDGYLPESLTGAYSGMFPRTTGAYVLLLIEAGQYDAAEQNIRYILKSLENNDMERIPRVLGPDYNIEDDQFQIDGHAHVVLAWARLALARGRNPFENQTWKQVRALMKFATSRAFFLHGHWYGHWSIEPNLVRNTAFEHSKDARMWDAFDLLTQSFVGAALTDMIQIAERQGDPKTAEHWTQQLKLLSDGIRKNLTTDHYGTTTYSEMLIPDGDAGVPYNGLGWVTLSPVAAGWEGVEHQILKNTVAVMNEKLLKHSNGVTWMPTDGYPDGSFSNEIIGKGIGWEIDFANSENDIKRLKEILHMIRIVNTDHPIYMEGAWLQGDNYSQNKRLHETDIPKMKSTVWKVKDAGNGEQTAWWCWAMARLRKSVGLSAQPKRF